MQQSMVVSVITFSRLPISDRMIRRARFLFCVFTIGHHSSRVRFDA